VDGQSYTARDATVDPGSSYFYKIGYRSGDAWVYSAPIEATALGGLEVLSLPHPNPVRDRCSFTIRPTAGLTAGVNPSSR
jgi:hypothetical protein